MASGISKETQNLLDKVVEDRDFDFKENAKGLKADQIVLFFSGSKTTLQVS
jgi:hypothetical protein